jgi:hypothetical protein
MKLVLGHICWNIQLPKSPESYAFDIIWKEINQLDMMTREIEADLSSFRKLLFEETPVRNPGTQSVRSKRRLVDVLGYWLKYLFGTVDVRDVKRLTAFCDEIHAFESRMVHRVEHHLTL